MGREDYKKILEEKFMELSNMYATKQLTLPEECLIIQTMLSIFSKLENFEAGNQGRRCYERQYVDGPKEVFYNDR